ADIGLSRAVPEVAAGAASDVVHHPLSAVAKLLEWTTAVADRPVLLDEIRRVGAHAPLVTVLGDFAVDIDVVEQHEFASELVMIGGDGFGEEAEVWITIALLHVAEDLIVGAILLDDVEAVLDGAGLAELRGDWVGCRHLANDAAVFAQRAAGVSALGVAGKDIRRRHRDGAQVAAEDAADVLVQRLKLVRRRRHRAMTV